MSVGIMPDIKEYKTLDDAANDARVPYTQQWLRVLVRDGKVPGELFGTGKRAVWVIHMPSLLAYVARMERLGSQKFVT